MGISIGAGASRPINPSQLLGIAEFDPAKPYSAGKFVLKGRGIYRFKVNHAANTPWDETEVKQVSTLDLVLASVGDPRIKSLSTHTPNEGDMLFFDRALGEYCTVDKSMVTSVLADYNSTRYETNYDTFIGMQDGKAHFVASNDAMPTQSHYSNTVAATSCYYRLEIEVGASGSITFSAASGNASIAETTITWSASNTLNEIVAMFTAKNTTYITFAKLADDNGVGLEIGGYGANTLTVTGTPTNCNVIDCSMLAFYRSQNPGAPAVGGMFNPNAGWTYVRPNTHNNFRGAAASSILTGKNLIGASTVCVAVDGYNYSYRCGVNFAKWKAWATTGGESTFYDDGEDGISGSGHIGDPGAHVMNEATFNAGVRDYTGSDPQHLGMKDYYTHLFNDQAGEFAALRQSYEAKYGQMTGTAGKASYDAYLMSHMIDPGANSGITNSMRNKGKNQTEVKADCMNVTYNYIIIPAYPPEYNAHTYGVAASEGFAPNAYYHPEPGDIGLFLRDDIMSLVNANIVASGGTQLNNSTYMGSSADYNGNGTWCFYGAYGCFTYNDRYNDHFRSRPVLALPLS